MKKQTIFILAILFLLGLSTVAQATSLDEMYRDIIKSDNHGYLPMFVKNRHAPEFLFDNSVNQAPVVEEEVVEDITINLINERKLKKEQEIADKIKWDNTISAIANNKVTPVELEEVSVRVENNNAKATEVLAWMYTKGVGVKTDFIEAFQLYQKAIVLQVPNAKENAAEIYKAMSKEQKEVIVTLKNSYLENVSQ